MYRVNPHDIHERLTKFLRVLVQQKHCQLGLKEAERVQNEKGMSDPHNSTCRKQADKTTQFQTCATSHEKGSVNEERTKRPESVAKNHRGFFPPEP